eukprot:CAMPEP_0118931074 /NCGR_PEP_ID=MMETSP1169-20130426/7543_1 /TAXON_ID=36882 /ORGANISM="Pyramimonas obovata, Strain CCMP722" /LENGTH=145 /DNA_ID=CAMNT_0006873529 /DNA_START=503 /DNA_END=936 /DNA_ORIENTATION=+
MNGGNPPASTDCCMRVTLLMYAHPYVLKGSTITMLPCFQSVGQSSLMCMMSSTHAARPASSSSQGISLTRRLYSPFWLHMCPHPLVGRLSARPDSGSEHPHVSGHSCLARTPARFSVEQNGAASTHVGTTHAPSLHIGSSAGHPP